MREQLQRVLRTPEVLFIGINGVVGGGIFLLPGQVAQSADVVVVLIGLSFAGGQHHVRPDWRPISVCRGGDGKVGGLHDRVDGVKNVPGEPPSREKYQLKQNIVQGRV
jgi:hypothetical protein